MEGKTGRLTFLGALAAGGGALLYSRQASTPPNASPRESLRVVVLQDRPQPESHQAFPMLQEVEFERLMDLLVEADGAMAFGLLGDGQRLLEFDVRDAPNRRRVKTARVKFRNEIVRRMSAPASPVEHLEETLRMSRAFLADGDRGYLVLYGGTGRKFPVKPMPGDVRVFAVNYNDGSPWTGVVPVEAGDDAIRQIRRDWAGVNKRG